MIKLSLITILVISKELKMHIFGSYHLVGTQNIFKGPLRNTINHQYEINQLKDDNN